MYTVMTATKNPISTRSTLEHMNFSIDVDNIIVDCNPKFFHTVGYDKDEIIGMSVFEHTPKSEHDIIHRILEDWKSDQISPNNREFSLLTRDGKTLDVLVTDIETVYSNEQQVQRRVVLLDRRELTYLQEKVMLSKYESLYEDSPDMYRTINVNGIIIECNQAYAQKLGYTKEEIVGKNLTEHTAKNDITPMLINMAQWRRDGACHTIKAHLKKKNGDEFPVTITPTNLYDDDGAILGRNVVIQDMSEMEEQKVMLKERQLIDQIKDEFLTGITHELKTHLTPIIGFSQILTQPNILGDLNKQQLDVVQTISQNAITLRQLLTSMLNVNKIEMEAIKSDYGEFDIGRTIEEIKSTVQQAAEKKSISVTFDVQLQGMVVGDKHNTALVLTHLLYNVIDLTLPDAGEINVVVTGDGKFVRFEVISNNVHVQTNELGGVFDKINQWSPNVINPDGSTKLSLFACKGIAEAMGGTLNVRSVDDENIMFYFTIIHVSPS